MQGYTLSVQARKVAKSYGMAAPEYLIYADLRAAGWCQRDAWSVAFQGKGLNWDKAELEREMNKLEALGSVQKRVEEQTNKKSAEDLTPEQLAKATSKEQILKDLVIARSKIRNTSSKEWADYTKMIGDFARVKQDDLKTEDTTMHFYLPAAYPKSCADCLLFRNGKADFQKKR